MDLEVGLFLSGLGAIIVAIAAATAWLYYCCGVDTDSVESPPVSCSFDLEISPQPANTFSRAPPSTAAQPQMTAEIHPRAFLANSIADWEAEMALITKRDDVVEESLMERDVQATEDSFEREDDEML